MTPPSPTLPGLATLGLPLAEAALAGGALSEVPLSEVPLSGLVLSGATLAWVGLCLGAAGTAAVRASRRVPVPPIPVGAGQVLLVRPCAGTEPDLAARLAAGATLRSTLPVHHRLTVAHPEDPALPAVQEAVLALRARGCAADWQVHPPLGPNEKVSQLHGAVTAAVPGPPVAAIACVDSDVDLAGYPLDPLVAPLLAGRAAATWAPPVEVAPPAGLGDRASQAVLGGSLHAFPLLRGIDPRGLVGKCFAVHPDALDRAGGFAALAEHLGEDMELAARLLRAGRAIEATPQPARSVARGRTVGGTVARYARWLAVIRAQRPLLLLSYPLLFAPLPLQLALLAATAAAHPVLRAASLGIAALAVLVASLTALAARRLSRLPCPPLAPLVDPLLAQPVLLLAWGRALLSRRLAWRGRHLRIVPGGRLQRDGPATTPPGSPAGARRGPPGAPAGA